MDYLTFGTLLPFIPKDLITEEEIKVLDIYGFEKSEAAVLPPSWYFFARNYESAPIAYISVKGDGFEFEEGIHYDESNLLSILQGIVKRSNGRLEWIYFEACCGDRDLTPGSCGGTAWFVTKDVFAVMGKDQWTYEQMKAATTRIKAEEIIQKFDGNLTVETLDDVVHYAKSKEASRINNDGIDAQVNYLLSTFGFEEGSRIINESILRDST